MYLKIKQIYFLKGFKITIFLYKNTRYYKIYLSKTLFNDFEIERIYGNVTYKAPTGIKINSFDDENRAIDFIKKLTFSKISKGYKSLKKLSLLFK